MLVILFIVYYIKSLIILGKDDNVDITSDVSEYASAREKIGIDVNSITHVKNKTIDFPTTCISLFTQRHPTEFYFNNNSITIYL